MGDLIYLVSFESGFLFVFFNVINKLTIAPLKVLESPSNSYESVLLVITYHSRLPFGVNVNLMTTPPPPPRQRGYVTLFGFCID